MWLHPANRCHEEESLKIIIRPIHETDKEWIDQALIQRWGSTKIVTRGIIHSANAMPGFIAEVEHRPEGLITYRLSENACEIISLDSFIPNQGIGGALVQAVERMAREKRCTRIWLITTNDNIHAIRFYQRIGYFFAALHRNAIEASRKLKPQIPPTGFDGIPIRDELEFEKRF